MYASVLSMSAKGCAKAGGTVEGLPLCTLTQLSCICSWPVGEPHSLNLDKATRSVGSLLLGPRGYFLYEELPRLCSLTIRSTVPFSTVLACAFLYHRPARLIEGSMDIPATYLWQTVYLAAVLETDNPAMPTRIYEALAAIEQRRLSPIEAGGIEDRAMEDAQRGLLALKAERTAAVCDFNQTLNYASGHLTEVLPSE
jgi:hypothetical protein